MEKQSYIKPGITVVVAEPSLMSATSPDPPSWKNDDGDGGGVKTDGGLNEDPDDWGKID